MSAAFLDGRVILHTGDCRAVLKTLAENSVDSVVTDPPYHLTSIVKRFGGAAAAPAKEGKDGAFRRASAGFMCKQWDGGDIAFQTELWAEVLRVLKPGAYILAFSGCRTYHRMACAVEDAGFLTHPLFCWAFGSGFPKAHNLSKQVDKEAGASGSYGEYKSARHANMAAIGHCNHDNAAAAADRPWMDDPAAVARHCRQYVPATEASRAWDGWFYGTQSLKPALEPIYFGQKPFSEKTGAANVLRWGTGAVNVGACRIGQEGGRQGELREYRGRWPANLIHDGSEDVLACFPDAGSRGNRNSSLAKESESTVFGRRQQHECGLGYDYDNAGAAARFFARFPQEAPRIFYSAKAGLDDRLGSKHPTVKPVGLLQYLVRLVTPPNGICLDLFAGSGTTGEAAFREGFRAILIEREAEYIADIGRRMALVMEGPAARKQRSAAARGRAADAGPLFGYLDDSVGSGRRVYGKFASDALSGRTIGPIGMKR